MGLHISFKHPFGSHSLLGGAVKTAGKLAPLAGLIPGVGTLGAAGIGGLAKLLSGGNPLTGALEGGAGSMISDAGGGLKGLAGTIGGALKNQQGGLDLGKLIGAGAGVAGMIGQGQQRKSAQNYANARTGQLNDLMSKILSGGRNYGLPNPNLNEQSSATSAGY